MGVLRRLLGLFVMIAGIIGLLLSLAGLAGLWMVRPTLTASMNATIATLTSSVDVSQETLVTTQGALGATVTSLEALSQMLGTTADTVEDTQPVITQLNDLMGETLPTTLEAARDSLDAAGVAAQSLESAIQSFDTFRTVMGTAPLLSAFVSPPEQTYNPEKPLADSLLELAESLEEMPATFEDISVNVASASENLDLIQSNLDTMSQSVSLISTSLSNYQATIDDSRSSMDNLKSMLSGLQGNLGTILNAATLVIGLFLLWLLAAQVVIFSQGWELYHGTAHAMAGASPASAPSEEEIAPAD